MRHSRAAAGTGCGFAPLRAKTLAAMRLGEAAGNKGGKEMSTYYVAVSALIFALVAAAHVARLLNGWAVQIGPLSVPMSVSWVGLVVSALMAIWGFVQLGQ
jgi:hypothetical protein